MINITNLTFFKICCSFVHGRDVNGNVYDRVDNAACCNGVQYNKMTQLCHKGHLIVEIPHDNNDPKMCGG